jgi:DNA-binding MltR family transcriptional regulator
MQIETILNHVQKFKSFVYKSVRWVENASDPTIKWIFNHARTAIHFAVSVDIKDLGMIDYLNVALNSFRCGASTYFSFMHPGRELFT